MRPAYPADLGSNCASHSGSNALATRAWWHRSRITGMPSGRRLRATAALRDVHPSDRQGLEQLGLTLHPGGQLRFRLRGDRDLTVHACRQAPSVALRHPPHAHQRVRARPEHQLLQTADPCEVPRLRRREDPLPQAPYVSLCPPPVNLTPVKGRVLWSVRHDCGVQHARRFRCHVLFLFTGSPDRVSALSSRTIKVRIRPVTRDGRRRGQPSMFRFPVAFRPPAFASRSSDTRRGSGPSSRSAYRTTASPGPRQGYHVPHARAATGVGAPSTPGTAVLTRSAYGLRPAPAASRRPVPTPRYNIPSTGLGAHETSTGVHAIHPSGLPLACGPRMERAPLGSPLSFEPRRLIADDARQGGDRPPSTGLELSRHQPTLHPLVHSRRATSCRTRGCTVTPDRGGNGQADLRGDCLARHPSHQKIPTADECFEHLVPADLYERNGDGALVPRAIRWGATPDDSIVANAVARRDAAEG